VGPTTKITTRRLEYIPYKKIVTELSEYFATSPPPDYITFSGYGEPTLNSAIGKIIQFIKRNKHEIPAAVLTNGTMLSSTEVRNQLLDADLVLPSLNAATQQIFEKINIPAKGLDIDEYIQGIADFRKEFS
jgi:wyosine [tRNA(Phe)-imidazoG37] synthetase (radical SAM superfamily)